MNRILMLCYKGIQGFIILFWGYYIYIDVVIFVNSIYMFSVEMVFLWINLQIISIFLQFVHKFTNLF